MLIIKSDNNDNKNIVIRKNDKSNEDDMIH